MSLDFAQSIALESKRQLRVLLKEKERRLGLVDLHYFCKHILGYSDLTEKDGFHGEYCRHLQDKENKFKLSLTPRGSLKSSVGTIGGTLQDIARNPNIRVLLASEKFTISTKFLSEIKGHIENNDKFIALYGDLRGKTKWSESEITVNTRTNWKKEPTVSCAGIDVTKVGMHYDRIRVDDPHSDQNTSSQDQIDKVIRWYKLLLSLIDPGGYVDITGTIWHYNDLYSYIINKERERVVAGRKKRFSILQRDSFVGTNDDLMNDRVTPDRLLWPERLSAEFLKDQLIEQGPYIFSCQYRLQPVDDETAFFKRSWLKSCTMAEVPKNILKYSTIDPMVDEDGSDYLAVTTVGVDENWQFYILDVVRMKADEHDTVDELYRVYKGYKPIKMGIETVVFQKSYYKYITMIQMMRGIRLPMVQLKTDNQKSKRLRIKGMVPYFKAGLYTIVCENGLDNLTGGMATLVDELTRYPKIRNDDCADALSYMNQLTQRPGVIHILSKIPKGSFKDIKSKIKKFKGVLGAKNVRSSRRLHG